MLPGIEVRELVHAVQNVGHEFLRGRSAGPRRPCRPAGRSRPRPTREVVVVAGRGDSLRGLGMLLEDVADLATNLAEPIEVEPGQADLDRPGIVKAGVGLEIDMQSLG